MEEKQEENGDAFDREAYLRNEEQFQDVEIVVPGRTVSNINQKSWKRQQVSIYLLEKPPSNVRPL